MSIVRSFSVGNGDMFAIQHDDGDLTVIDVCLTRQNVQEIKSALKSLCRPGGTTRLIITHPDEDHIRGLSDFIRWFPKLEIYSPPAEPLKAVESSSFRLFKALRQMGLLRPLAKGWTKSQANALLAGSTLRCFWPDLSSNAYRQFAFAARRGLGSNNCSPGLILTMKNGATLVWLGDLETAALARIPTEDLPQDVDIVFAPHHGRKSAKIPASILKRLNPQVVVLGEGSSEHLHYSYSCQTVTQNSWRYIEISETDFSVTISGCKSMPAEQDPLSVLLRLVNPKPRSLAERTICLHPRKPAISIATIISLLK